MTKIMPFVFELYNSSSLRIDNCCTERRNPANIIQPLLNKSADWLYYLPTIWHCIEHLLSVVKHRYLEKAIRQHPKIHSIQHLKLPLEHNEVLQTTIFPTLHFPPFALLLSQRLR